MFHKKNSISVLVFAGVLALAIVAFLNYSNEDAYSEEKKLAGIVWSEVQYATYFSHLAEEKGSRYAFELLRRVDLSPGVTEHSVAHAIGYVLFEERGVSGMYDCTEEFRSACAHAIVIQALSREGDSVVEDIARTCMSAPGGRGAYAICFHGVGHGLVASLGYDFTSAVLQCSHLSDIAPDDSPSGHRFTRPAEECLGGAVMEMLQGEHDKTEWKKAVDVYLPVDEPFRPCTDEYVPRALRSACFVSLTQRLFGAVGISEDLPLPGTYPEAMSVCASAPREDDRTACYAGFGKEFVFFATQFDSGDVNTISEKALMNIRDWCGFAKDTAGVARCMSIAVDTLFWAGQNNPRSAVQFCASALEGDRESCYKGLIENIHYFLNGDEKMGQACALFPEVYRERCNSIE